MASSPTPQIGVSTNVAPPRRSMKYFIWLVVGYFILVWVGGTALRQPGVMANGDQLNPDRATFLAANCATLTGFQQAVGTNEFDSQSNRGPLIVFGLIVCGSLLALILGGMAGVRALGLPYRDGQIVLAAFLTETVAVLGGAAGLIGPSRSSLESLQMGAAAFGNCGVMLGKLPGTLEWRTHLLILPIAILGGFGLPVIMELYDAAFGMRRLSKHSKISLAWTAGVYCCSMAVLLWLLWPHQPVQTGDVPPPHIQIGWPEYQHAVASSSILSVISRTGGFAYDLLNGAPRAAQWIVALLMLVGASSAGTAGGLKTTTFHALFSGMRDVLKGRVAHRTFGIAATWFGAYVIIATAGFIILLNIEPQLPADRCLFITISALSNVGLSHDQVSIVGGGLYFLSALMLVGRIAPLLVLCWLAEGGQEAEYLVG